MISAFFVLMLGFSVAEPVAEQTWHCATWHQIDRAPGLCETVFGARHDSTRAA